MWINPSQTMLKPLTRWHQGRTKKCKKVIVSNRQPDATSSWHNNPWPGAGGIWIKDLNRLILSPLGDQLSTLNVIPKKRIWRKVSQADWFSDSHVSLVCLSHCNKLFFKGLRVLVTQGDTQSVYSESNNVHPHYSRYPDMNIQQLQFNLLITARVRSTMGR